MIKVFLKSAFTNPYFIVGLLLFAATIIVLLLLFARISRNRLLSNIPNAFGVKIYGYLDKKGNVISFTNNFFERLNISNHNNWLKEITSININKKVLTYYELLDYIKDSKGNIVIDFEQDGEHVVLDLVKKVIDDEDHIYGYVLYEKEAKEVESKFDGLYDVVKDLYNPVAIYCGFTSDFLYYLNDNLQVKLGMENKYLKYSELRPLVFEEDLVEFDKTINNLYENSTIHFRLKTNMGLEMFEEKKKFFEGRVISILSLVEYKKEKLYEDNNNKELLTIIREQMDRNIPFGGIMLSLKSLLNEEEMNSENSLFNKEVIKKYLRILEKELLQSEDKVIRVNDFEFVILINNIEDFDKIINNVYNDKSMLVYYRMDFGNKAIEIHNKIGLVYSSKLIYNEKDFINALDASLALANKEDYGKDYSIYSPKKDDINPADYSFDKIKDEIDLDNSFLKDDK